ADPLTFNLGSDDRAPRLATLLDGRPFRLAALFDVGLRHPPGQAEPVRESPGWKSVDGTSGLSALIALIVRPSHPC
ncbi:hypothetical protein KVH09_36060, partial [Streptomyces olivaceus]|nr:hypothetical protein [Streptomyces olivaceus]